MPASTVRAAAHKNMAYNSDLVRRKKKRIPRGPFDTAPLDGLFCRLTGQNETAVEKFAECGKQYFILSCPRSP